MLRTLRQMNMMAAPLNIDYFSPRASINGENSRLQADKLGSFPCEASSKSFWPFTLITVRQKNQGDRPWKHKYTLEHTHATTHMHFCFTACHQGVLFEQQVLFWTAYLLAGGRQINSHTHTYKHVQPPTHTHTWPVVLDLILRCYNLLLCVLRLHAVTATLVFSFS